MASFNWFTRHHAAPIDRIPVELLAEIMIIALPHFNFARHNWYFHGEIKWRDTLRLAGVSSRWKQVAENTPYLWSRFRLTGIRPGKSKAKELLMKTWISRARAVPLSLSVDLSWGSTNKLNMRCLNFLKDNLHRCQHLQVKAPAHVISALIHGSFPQLETVRLLPCDRGFDPTLRDVSLCSTAPRMQLIRLESITSDFNVKSFSWSGITELVLDIGSEAFVPYMAMLAECTNLHVLRVTMAQLIEEDVLPWLRRVDRPRPRYEKLHTIEVDAPGSYCDFSFFVAWLFAPSLRRLKLCGCVMLYPDLIKMIPRDGCMLEELIVDQYGSEPFESEEEHLLRFFESLPDLRRLEICGITDAFRADIIKRLTFKPGRNDCLLKKLESLKIYWLGGYAGYWDIQLMLESRIRLGKGTQVAQLEDAEITMRCYTQKHHWRLGDNGKIWHDGYFIHGGGQWLSGFVADRRPVDED
ncbi:hypothetical protein GLOTRDRAFT_133463 [Gloeophyllum trabeum ATCC 11539]|uniref:Uncharacterized protein n=1 Tax=Gloeophyllum trabeum (strain ATCC 11539 / FP-39264 / Madison 617) TaxID=670483 RepID=S7RF67_GLOTA|nr:uncharacterized protein GLOTRDRAFT_133463 [Gloeophyllum trabeum ATCC 11539]EPQ51144.1 hypothetical protein GLOTRDRAFT_133463 [Gloeophyllum trabeum ATCC 11539]